ncbi:MAG: DUF424 family protein [Nanoarchaeota archaeon]
MADKILIKIHDRGVVSVCDSVLLGKTLDEGDLHLEINEKFFKGEERTDVYIVGILECTGNATIVGKHAIELAVKNGIVEEKCVKKIGKVPFAYVFAV